jgi:hypothetical protein
MDSKITYADFEEETFDELVDSTHAASQIPFKYSYQKNKLQKPRRNKSAFIFFSAEARAKLRLDDGSLNSNEMMVRLADLWKNLSDKEREKYNLLARDDKLRYQQELVDFAKTHPNETIHNKTKNNHVKKPCSAYGIFLRERKDIIKRQQPNLKMADVLKIVSQDWKRLNDVQRRSFQEKANKEKEAVKSKLCETQQKEQTKSNPMSRPKNIKKKLKTDIKEEDLRENVKMEPSFILNNGNNWSVAEETPLPSKTHLENSDIQIKTEVPYDHEGKQNNIPLFSNPSLELMINTSMFLKPDVPLFQDEKQNSLQLFSNLSFDFDLMLNTSLFLKQQENSNDPTLFNILTKSVHKPNDLRTNFDMIDKLPSLSFLEPSFMQKFKGDSVTSISQFLNTPHNHNKAAQSRGQFLRDTIISALDIENEPNKDLFFEETL